MMPPQAHSYEKKARDLALDLAKMLFAYNNRNPREIESDATHIEPKILGLVSEAVEAERESAAQIVESCAPDYIGNPAIGFPSLREDVRSTLQKAAAAIRARGKGNK